MAVTQQTMTVGGLLKRAMSLMGEEGKYESGYAPFVADIVNQLLADCFDINNSIRENAGKTPLASVPYVTKTEDELPYEYETLASIMVYGLAYWLLFQDDENDKANACNMMYEQNKIRFTKAAYADVADNY
ncbi:hypothetical protein [Christensenella timonensis]|uniref:hypothetical protein n=1 Tax=Christensenella timonensis TaxID=1816678 RepID=UPI00082A2246|nr:hypothetical protein [Christensenella timonensis]